MSKEIRVALPNIDEAVEYLRMRGARITGGIDVLGTSNWVVLFPRIQGLEQEKIFTSEGLLNLARGYMATFTQGEGVGKPETLQEALRNGIDQLIRAERGFSEWRLGGGVDKDLLNKIYLSIRLLKGKLKTFGKEVKGGDD